MSEANPRPAAPSGGDVAVPPATDAGAGTAARRARRAAKRSAATTAPRPGSGATDDAAGVAPTPTARRGGDLDPDALAALEEQRSFLLRSLDDLEREHDAGDVDDVDYEALRDDYTFRAAQVIRSIEQRQAAFASARAPRRRSRAVVWVVALLVGSVALGIFVAQSSGRREAGDSISGDIRVTSRDQLLEARVAMGEGRFLDAIASYDEILAAQPANTEALTYKGWLLYLTSRQTEDPADTQVLLARSKELLDEALAIDGSYGDALVFRANVLHQLGFDDQALADLDAIEPGSIPDFMLTVVDQLRADVEAGTTASGAEVAPS